MENNFICYRVCINIVVRRAKKKEWEWRLEKSLFPIKLSNNFPSRYLTYCFLLYAGIILRFFLCKYLCSTVAITALIVVVFCWLDCCFFNFANSFFLLLRSELESNEENAQGSFIFVCNEAPEINEKEFGSCEKRERWMVDGRVKNQIQGCINRKRR